MPRWVLSKRNADLIELMDDPDCDPHRLARTYDWFAHLNPWLARWTAVYSTLIRPALRPGMPNRILDIGCGGGDLLELVKKLAVKDGFEVELTGIDPDERAIAHARERVSDPQITLRDVHSSELVNEGAEFDIVLSNHVLHHLDDNQLQGLLRDSQTLASMLVLHNDICRDDLAWLAFWPVGLVCRRSFILTDGLRSIRRAWHPDELTYIVPSGWEIREKPPFRTLLIYRSAS